MKKNKKIKKLSGEEVDKLFDSGSDEIDNYMDFSKRYSLEEFTKMIDKKEELNISFPQNIILKLDDTVNEIGVSKEDFIRMIVAERLNIIDMPHAS